MAKNSLFRESDRPPLGVCDERRRREEADVLVSSKFRHEIRKRWEAGTAISVDKGYIAQRTVELLNVVKTTAAPSELGDERVDTTEEFEAFVHRQRDLTDFEVP